VAQDPRERFLIRYAGGFAPLVVRRAEGAWVETTDGRRILDFTSGQICSTLGHGHPRIVEALRDLEREMNEQIEPSMDGVAHPYNINVGTFIAGDWPSSVPASAALRIRVGHPSTWTAGEAEARVRAAIDAVDDPWLDDRPPTIRASGFKAKGYALTEDDPLAELVATAHRAAHGEPPKAVGMASTTDARLYLNDFDVPAICYGPKAHDIHGIDEAVDLSSIVDGARTLARFIADWYGAAG